MKVGDLVRYQGEEYTIEKEIIKGVYRIGHKDSFYDIVPSCLMELVMESWRKVFRTAIKPLLSEAGIAALKKALEEDDPRLIQGATTTPPPLHCVMDWEVEAACGLSYCGWQGDGLKTVGEVEEFFASFCFNIDQLLGEPAGCRWFLNWFDETPRDEMRRILLQELNHG